MPDQVARFAPLAGRILLAILFLLTGSLKLMYWEGSVQGLASKHLPASALLLAAAVTLELAGGLALITGLYARVTSALLFLYLVPTTLLFHNFWALSGPEQSGQMINFFKNLAIMGGLLLLVANGPGPYSIRWPRPKSAE